MAVHIHPLRPAVAIVALVVIGCGTSVTATTTSAPYTPVPFTVRPVVVPAQPIATATAGPESSLLTAMTPTFGACAIKAPPSGAVVAQVDCTTPDLVSVSVAQYKTAAATAAAFKAQAGAIPGGRCSAGAYLGTYRAAGRIVGQLGCDGTYVTVAWTVPRCGYISRQLLARWPGSIRGGSITGRSARVLARRPPARNRSRSRRHRQSPLRPD